MKNLATWLLAAAFTTAALPAFAVEPSVQVGYSPEGSARVLVLSAIDSAKTSIRMMAYSFRGSKRESQKIPSFRMMKIQSTPRLT